MTEQKQAVIRDVILTLEWALREEDEAVADVAFASIYKLIATYCDEAEAQQC